MRSQAEWERRSTESLVRSKDRRRAKKARSWRRFYGTMAVVTVVCVVAFLVLYFTSTVR
jgi:cobalamin biosynthesis protein CobD/CbiB